MLNEKRTLSFILLTILAGVFVSWTAHAGATNVALNAQVQLQGAPFFTGGFGGGLTVSPNTVTDGVFLPRITLWDQGAVWWDSHDSLDRWVLLSLGNTYRIESFTVQADNNDQYHLVYHDIFTDTWELAWTIPSVEGLGMETRPDPLDETARHFLPTSIVTDAFMFSGDSIHSDRFFSVSEIQAFGYLLVQIDIKPGSYPNCFNVNGHGVIPVSVLGDDDLDVFQIDTETLLFAGLEVRVRGNRGPLCSYEDSNSDGRMDLVCHFEDDPGAWEPADSVACVSGNFLSEYGGGAFEGCDSVCIVPHKKK